MPPHNGTGAVLSQQMEDGLEHPVTYASRSLSKAERNYFQLDCEGLAVVFGVKKFHMYLYGRDFLITADHKPLLGLFKEENPHPLLRQHVFSDGRLLWQHTDTGYSTNAVKQMQTLMVSAGYLCACNRSIPKQCDDP